MKPVTLAIRLNKFVEEYHPEHTELIKNLLMDFLLEVHGKVSSKTNKKIIVVRKKKKAKKDPNKIVRFTKKTYQEYLDSQVWKNKKMVFYSQNPRCCKKCGSTDKIVLHHRFYNYGNTWGDSLEGLMAVCETCHNKIHKEANRLVRGKISKKTALLKASGYGEPSSLEKDGTIRFHQNRNREKELEELKKTVKRLSKK